MTTDVPQGWCRCSLGEVAEIKSGLTLGKKRSETDSLRLVPYLRVANVQRGHLDLSEIKQVPATTREIDELRLEPGDVLMNEGGDRDKLGRGWIWSGEITDCIHQNHVFRVRLAGGLSPVFVSHYANSVGQKYFHGEGKQSTNLASINKSNLSALPLVVPPTAEQARIVAKLDAVFAQTRAAKARLERLPALIEKLKRSILAAAFRGDLTADWRAANPDVEPASALTARIRVQHREAWEGAELRKHTNKGAAPTNDKWKDKYSEPALEAGEPHAVPASWQWVPLDLVRAGDAPMVYGIILPGEEVADGVPYIRPIDIDARGLIKTDSLKRTSASIAAQYTRSSLLPGDLVLSIVGTIGKLAAVPPELRGANITQSSVRIRPSDGMSATLLAWALQSPCLTQQYDGFRFGNAVQRLNIEHVRRLIVPLPPAAEQVEICRRLTASFAALATLNVESLQERFAKLESAALASAFRGELVPQDPADEPAEVLLERIRAAKAEEAPVVRRPRAAAATTYAAPPVTLAQAAESGPLFKHALDRQARVAAEPAALDLVVAALQQSDGRLTAAAIAQATGLAPAAIRAPLKELVAAGQVRTHGKARGTTYEWIA